MKLQAPYSGGFVEAEGEQAKALIAKGFKQVDTPKKPTRKRTTKKEG